MGLCPEVLLFGSLKQPQRAEFKCWFRTMRINPYLKNDIKSMSEWMHYGHSNPFLNKLYVSCCDSAHITTFCSTKRLITSHQETSPCTWNVACVVWWQVPHGGCVWTSIHTQGFEITCRQNNRCERLGIIMNNKKTPCLMIVLSSSHAGWGYISISFGGVAGVDT